MQLKEREGDVLTCNKRGSRVDFKSFERGFVKLPPKRGIDRDLRDEGTQ